MCIVMMQALVIATPKSMSLAGDHSIINSVRFHSTPESVLQLRGEWC